MVLLADGTKVEVSGEIKVEPVKQSFMPKRPRDVFAHIGAERIVNTWGSASGAGSDFFDIYRKHRARESDREEQMQTNFQEEIENKIFQARREERINKLLASAAKKREHRKKRKLKANDKMTDKAEKETEGREEDKTGEENSEKDVKEGESGEPTSSKPKNIIINVIPDF